jgi:two-component system OmpR family sensor kinase
MLHKEEAGDFKQGKVLKRDRDLSVYVYDAMIYLHFKDKRQGVEHYFRYYDEKLDNKRIVLFALLIDLAVMLFFFYVIRRIWPLRELKNAIERFSRGNLDVHTQTGGKDEIAEVSNAFDKAIHQIKQLQESRNLFLRNIMHELKTPIAKGKLITDLLEDKKNATRLSQIFMRFEHLLSEFAKIERVTSNELDLNIKKFRTVDLLDNALDILMIDRDSILVDIEVKSDIHADFELFSIAIKNLIDNALKYGNGKPHVIIQKDSVTIASKGDALDSALFEHVFNRKFEDSSKGLGLGLYITKNIVQKHGFEFEYLHVNGINRFIIHFH